MLGPENLLVGYENLQGGMIMLTAMVRGVLDLLWPPRTACLLCEEGLSGAPVLAVCNTCWQGMGFPPGLPLCTSCHRPVPGDQDLCVECVQGSRFGRAWALGLHTGPLREAIHHLKFNGRDELGVPLGRRLAARVREPYHGVIPIPLHRSRLRERGYNQAALIARGLAQELRLPLWEGALVRSRNTGHQAKLDRSDRLRNLQGAFRAAQGPAPWVGAAILLVDDVLTTGTTAAAAAEVLRQTGAARVDLAVLAVSATPVRESPERANQAMGFHENPH